jgi:hypothetical protein
MNLSATTKSAKGMMMMTTTIVIKPLSMTYSYSEDAGVTHIVNRYIIDEAYAHINTAAGWRHP